MSWLSKRRQNIHVLEALLALEVDIGPLYWTTCLWYFSNVWNLTLGL